MIHEIGVDIGAQLSSKGCPIHVIDGPEFRKTSTFARERIVIEHDPSGDSFGSRRLADTNPRTRLTRNVGVKITIVAQNPSKGANYWEHIRRAEHVLDLVLIALDVVAKQRKNLVVFQSGKFVQPDDFKEGETPGGAVYELLLTFDRGVADRKWDGSVLPTVVISPQLFGGPTLTFTASSHTIVRSFGSWLLDGFAVGTSVLVSGTVSNNGAPGVVTALTDTTMTFAAGLVNETATAAVVTGNGALVHNTFTISGFTQSGGPGSENA